MNDPIFSDAENELLDALILLKRLNNECPNKEHYEEISGITKEMLKVIQEWRKQARKG